MKELPWKVTLEIRMLLIAKISPSWLSGTPETKFSESELNFCWMPIVKQWIFLYMLFYRISQQFYQKDAIISLSLMRKLRFREVEWLSQGCIASVKVVWRPGKAMSGKHSLHFIVRRPLDDSVEWWGQKADYSRFKGRWGPRKWIEQVRAVFWRTERSRELS